MMELPDWLKEKEEPDKQFYDVTWHHINPFGRFPEPFEPFLEVKPSTKKTHHVAHKCYIGTAICARVAADNENEAIANFWKAVDRAEYMMLYG
jgi:hypothetical protein